MSKVSELIRNNGDDAKVFDLLIKFGLALVFAARETMDQALEDIDTADLAKRSVEKADSIVKALDYEMSRL